MKVLISAIGNPDRGDDGVGSLVAAHIAGRLPRNVSLLVRSGDMLGLLDAWADCDAVICIDATSPMGAPGRIRRIDPVIDALPVNLSPTSSHAFGLAETILLARTLKVLPGRAVIYAIEGACFDAGAPMTAAVAQAAAEAAKEILDETRRLCSMVGEALPHA